MARVTVVKAARQDQGQCGRCGDALPKGSAYRWAQPGFRGAKMVRCMKPQCYFRSSELTQSKASTIMAATEAFEDNIDSQNTADDITEAVGLVAEAARDVADEYREALDAFEYGNAQHEERADHYENVADELENFSLSMTLEDEPKREDFDPNDYDDEEELQREFDEAYQKWEETVEEARDEAREAINAIEYM